MPRLVLMITLPLSAVDRFRKRIRAGHSLLCPALMILFSAGLAVQAQEWISTPVSDANVTTSFQTIGGITYAVHSILLRDSGVRLGATGPLLRQGTNFYLEATLMRSTNTVVLPVIDNLVFGSTLGALTNGTYRFYYTSFGIEVVSSTFTVAAGADDPGAKTIYQYRFLTNGIFTLSAEVPFLHNYNLQASLDLTNWVNISTNSGGRINGTDTDPGAATFTRRFYRLKID
jgi:hypothetical protein